MNTISPFMNGESAMSDPVSGLRSGAPGGSVSSAKKARHAEQSPERVLQTSRLLCRETASASVFLVSLSRIRAEPRLDHLVADERDDHREQEDRGDGEPEVRRQRDGDGWDS